MPYSGIMSIVALAFVALTGEVQSQLVDPTRPPDFDFVETAELPAVLANWELTGIKYGAKRRLAILNNRVVVEGDTLGAAKIVAIEPGSVLIEHEGKKLKVDLLPRDVKKSVGSDE